MKLTVEALGYSAEKSAIIAEFGRPLSEIDLRVLKRDGFSAARAFAASGMEWVWLQWLLAGAVDQIRAKVGAFVDKGMAMQEMSSLPYMRAHADLYQLHCAIFASPAGQLEKLASRVVDVHGLNGRKPEEKGGELYASAWCGMLKHWILGDFEESRRQAEVIWSAYRDASFAAAPKPLVTPWLKGDWNGFVKAQQKDFEKLWARGRKDGTVRSEAGDEVTVTVQRYPVEQKWCWAHCGLALLAYRRGVEVTTDQFWFPPHALKCVDTGK
jgi:hypothetical protein